MAHAQQQVIDALQTLLAAGATVAATRVYADRFDPLQASELPAIVLQEGGETIEPYTIASVEKRELTVQLHCVLAHNTTAISSARTFGLAVEKLIAASTTLAALCLEVRLTASRPDVDTGTDSVLASRVQSWTFSYLVQSTAPDTIL